MNVKHFISFFVVLVIVAGFVSVGCKRHDTSSGQHLTDAEISRKAVGVWTVPHVPEKMEVRSDGSYFQGTGTSVIGGSWHIEDGYFVAIITNMPGHTPGVFGQPTRYKITSIEDHQMTFVLEGRRGPINIINP